MSRRTATISAVALLLTLPPSASYAATIFTENFDNITTLAGSGWVITNNSSPAGTTSWFQGNGAIIPAQSGNNDSYIAANFNNADFGGNISNWLILPELTLNDGDTFSFYTLSNQDLPDRLEVRLSTNGASANVGSTTTSVGDFTTLLLSVNPNLDFAGYPNDWTQYQIVISAGSPINGRLAFRYFVPDTSANADYIGIDTVSLDAAPGVPEPATTQLILAGLGGIALGYRFRRTTRRS